MLPLKGDEEEVKEGKGLRILTSNKLLARLPVSLAQIKEIRKLIDLLYEYTEINRKSYSNLIKPL